jgi:cell division control protein 6
MEENVFVQYLRKEPLFRVERDILRPAYLPERLPHREAQVDQVVQILAPALRGERPSNILIHGQTGTGKTAVVKFIEKQLRLADPNGLVRYLYMNCQVVDTPYGVLANIANTFIEDHAEKVPFTGLSVDRVYQVLVERLDERRRVVILALDEIDRIVAKNGDDFLYQLTKVNEDLERSSLCLIGISNELKFTEYLDPRVQSRLGDEKLVFPPYNANELLDILADRARVAFEDGATNHEVLSLIAALAAQEHGDARRALDLLRVSAEIAERGGQDRLSVDDVLRAKNKLELDTVVEAVKALPTQAKLILLGVLLNEEVGNTKLTTGEVFATYRDLCRKTGIAVLSPRRVTDLVSELDMLGLVSATVKSFGRGGRTKQIRVNVPVLETKRILEKDEFLADLRGHRLQVQRTLFEPRP